MPHLRLALGTPSCLASPRLWEFNIDDYLNPYIPPSPVHRLPRTIAHFLGYRPDPTRRRIGNLLVIFWTFFGVFIGVISVNLAMAHVPAFQHTSKTTNITVTGGVNPAFSASTFGAAAVLQFYAIDSPLSQPRNAIGGQLLSSIVGVTVSKLFAFNGTERAISLAWLAGGLSTAASTCLMALTGTVHPPAGATALMAVIDENVVAIGWWLVAAVMLASAIIQLVSLLVNNIQRQHPMYWWSPQETGHAWRALGRQLHRFHPPHRDDPEECKKSVNVPSCSQQRMSAGADEMSGTSTTCIDIAIGRWPSATSGRDNNVPPLARTNSVCLYTGDVSSNGQKTIFITSNTVFLPESLLLLPEELLILETLSKRL